MENFEKYRSCFPHLQSTVYLDHASVSPLAAPVLQAMTDFLSQRHTGEIVDLDALLQLFAGLRRELARLIHAPSPDTIAFVPNTSTGLNILAQGLDWREGDRILLTDCEFPANVYPFLNLRDRGVLVDFVPCLNGCVPTEHLLRYVQKRTRLISLSLVEFLSGFRHDAAAIGQFCRENEILFALDGIQALGAVAVDVQAWNVSFLASGGQKWLLSPMGTGFIYVAPELLPRLAVSSPGWLSVEDAWNFFDYRLRYLPTAERFEPGTKPALLLAGMLAAAKMLNEVPAVEREKRVLWLSGYLIRKLREKGLRVLTPEAANERAGIVTFVPREPPEAVNLRLHGAGVRISLREGMLRVSPHFYNTLADLDLLLELL